MKVLIVGGGGREHALAWKAAQSPQAEKVFVAPGNAGTAREPGVENVPIGAGDIPALVAFARDNGITLTIIGPEAPLVAGVVDAFTAAGLPCFGPTAAAAQLEGSKSFCKDFFRRHHIPTAAFEVFTDVDAACAWIRERGAPIVVKADGLAAGKGVVVARTEAEAVAAVTDMLAGNRFGDAGHKVVIEEFLEGEEASFIVISDGEHAVPLAGSQDHKARDEGDTGPNTGGMGAYSPAPAITAEVHERIMDQVILPTIDGMAREGRRYLGFLYAGLMIGTDGQVKVLEFNCRFGDPETQPVLMRLRSDLVGLCLAALRGELAGVVPEWDPRAALGVVMASAGYPASASKGDVIDGLDQTFPEGVKVFHAGTAERDGRIVTDGGRVLCVTALGESVSEAQQRAYAAAAQIRCEGLFYRRDIGYRAVERESKIQT
ncbi:MAG: phosphoribosylamine--glycine ligase [Gammaproteobacteria bacterium]